MNRIRVLSAQDADQIAAGEVVERPASVVKELVENSLDAGASRVDVSVEAAGRSLIRVQDNGLGIEREDLALAFTRFATSKIVSAADLSGVATYGFRGEALASMAAIAEVEIASRRRGSGEGARCVARYGTCGPVEPWGGPEGTVITVRSLFGNTPARLRFLKTDGTERHHITRAVTALALGSPGAGITLLMEGKTLVETRGRSGLRARAAYLLGLDDGAPVIEISKGPGEIQVEGIAARPEAARGDRGAQFFIVNGRWIFSPALSAAFKEGFGPALPHDRHPAGVLVLTLPRSDIDVNVHPAKREIRFRRESEVRAAVREAVSRTLSAEKAPVAWTHGLEAAEPRPLWGDSLPNPEAASRIQAVRDALARPGQQPSPPNPGSRDLPGPGSRYLGQVGGLYLLVEDGEDLLIMDPHAAHERILYERLMARRQGGKPPSQLVLVTETLAFAPEYEPLLEEAAAGLEALGFELVRTGSRELSVRAVPPEGSSRAPGSLVRELVEAFGRRGGGGPVEERIKKLVSTAACRMAVMDGDRLSPEEANLILRDLALVEGAYTCPHGRPAAVRIARAELDRRFLRT